MFLTAFVGIDTLLVGISPTSTTFQIRCIPVNDTSVDNPDIPELISTLIIPAARFKSTPLFPHIMNSLSSKVFAELLIMFSLFVS